MVTRCWPPSVAEKFLAWKEGNVGCVCSLVREDWTNSADAGPVAVLEMVRDWTLCKQCCKPSPSCMQTDPAACSTVDLKYVEVA